MSEQSLASPSSFKDPSGYVFYHNGSAYRQINSSYAPEYRQFVKSGLSTKLVSRGMILPYEEVKDPRAEIPQECYTVLLPNQLSFVSYPYEWSFGQLKDSALLTLDILLESLNYGMILKDATPFNIQLFEGNLKHIDTLSFENYEVGKPWVAYRQYCESFLAPLVLMSQQDMALSGLLMPNLTGINLTLTNKLVPLNKRLNLGYILHIYLHQQNQVATMRKQTTLNVQNVVGKESLKALIMNLKNYTKSLKINKTKSFWTGYYEDNNYNEGSFNEKINAVTTFCEKVKPNTVWDVGCNTGAFSEHVSRYTKRVIAFDNDHESIEAFYQKTISAPYRNIYPIVADITNPTPSLGWENKERGSLLSRGPANLVLALALVHHLAIAGNVPFVKIADLFKELGEYLLVEFVPKSDSQVQRLLLHRKDVFPDYNMQNFEQTFSKYFNMLEVIRLQGSERVIYFMERKR